VYVLRPEDGQPAGRFDVDSAVESIALTRDESRVLCGLLDGRMALFDLPEGRKGIHHPAHPDTINAVAVHPLSGVVATASRDKTVGLWRLDGSTPIEVVRIPSPSGRPVLSVRFSPDGRFLGMLVQNERAVRVWDLDLLRKRLGSLGLDWE
jgi:WD40 repeat protein